MNVKRHMFIGLAMLLLVPSYGFALDINLPGADKTIPANAYQNYRVDNKSTRARDQEIEKILLKEKTRAEQKDEIYSNREYSHALSNASTVFVLKRDGADIRFTFPEISRIGITALINNRLQIKQANMMSRDNLIGYEMRKQPIGDNWEDTNIPYSELTPEKMRLSSEESPDIFSLSEKVYGSGLFSYPGIEKATWDVIKYENSTGATINFTMPQTPEISYHLIYRLGDAPWSNVKDKLAIKHKNTSDETIVSDYMKVLVNYVLPSIEPASTVLSYSNPVTYGPYTFRILKGSMYGRKVFNGGEIHIYSNDKIVQAISIRKLPPHINPYKSETPFKYALDRFLDDTEINNYEPIQFATVWNDSTPSAYFEVHSETRSIYSTETYDQNYSYSHILIKNKDSESSLTNEQLRTLVQYINNKDDELFADKYVLGLSAPPTLRLFNDKEEMEKYIESKNLKQTDIKFKS